MTTKTNLRILLGTIESPWHQKSIVRDCQKCVSKPAPDLTNFFGLPTRKNLIVVLGSQNEMYLAHESMGYMVSHRDLVHLVIHPILESRVPGAFLLGITSEDR